MNLAARLHLFRCGLNAPNLQANMHQHSTSVLLSLRHALHAPRPADSLAPWASTLAADRRQGVRTCSHGDSDGETAAGKPGSAEAAAPPGVAEAAVPTTALGQVMAAQANFVRVKVNSLEGAEDGTAPPRSRLLCVVRGLLKKIKQQVLVGDLVKVVGIDWADGRGMVEEVLPRSSQLSEPAVANVTHVLLVFATDMPPFQPSPATRFLLSAEAAGLPVTLVLNKADLADEVQVQQLVAQVSSWGYDVLPVSVMTGRGIEQLMAALKGQVSVVAGPSGAGKSSIINALRLRSLGLEGTLGEMQAAPSGWEAAAAAAAAAAAGQQHGPQQHGNNSGQAPPGPASQQRGIENGSTANSSGGAGGSSSSSTTRLDEEGMELQAVGQVSERIGRGKHTTRNVSLLEMGSGGLVVDTPGFNQPDLSMPATELGACFPEIRRRLEEQRCAFRSCQHLQEPGCVVRGDWERYPLYCEIHAELKTLEQAEAARAMSKKRREGNVRYKSRAGGQQGMEARLESKSYRRVSRRSERQRITTMDVEADEL